MNKKIVAVVTTSILIIAIFIISLPTLYSFVTYERNESGKTYGKLVESQSFIERYVRKEPDLIAVIATNGKEGYVKKTDFFPDLPHNPKEALEQEAANTDSVIPVYKTDGVTVIGDFEL